MSTPAPVGQQTWLITGCSTGLGRDLALAALARGDKVVATSRRTDSLGYLKNEERALTIQLDVTEEESVLRGKVEDAIANFGPIDVLANNAGYVLAGVWEEMSDEGIKKQFDTNFFGAMKMTKILLAHMRPRKTGVILFMGSIAGWYGGPATGPYTATKYALEGAAECLEGEVKGFGIRVHLLVYGRFRTDLLNVTKYTTAKPEDYVEDYKAVREGLDAFCDGQNGCQPGDPKKAAECVVNVVKVQNLSPKQAETLPLRIPCGAEAVDVMGGRGKTDSDRLVGWEDFARGMDFEDAKDLGDFTKR